MLEQVLLGQTEVIEWGLAARLERSLPPALRQVKAGGGVAGPLPD